MAPDSYLALEAATGERLVEGCLALKAATGPDPYLALKAAMGGSLVEGCLALEAATGRTALIPCAGISDWVAVLGYG